MAQWQLPAIRLKAIKPPAGPPDILTRIKKSWAGRIYIAHLKRIPVIRRLTIEAWRVCYPFYINNIALSSHQGSRAWRPLIKNLEYSCLHGEVTREIFMSTKVSTPMPETIPTNDRDFLVSPHNFYKYPAIYVSILNNARLYGGTNLVIMPDGVVCHDLYDFERDYTSEERHGRHVIDTKKKLIRIARNDTKPEFLPVAASFLDACAPNYAHWLTEVLPRIASFCSIQQYSSIPIVVDADLHPNIMESLALAAGADREVIILPVGKAIEVEKLYITSVTGYVPYERRTAKLSGHSHGLFSSLALNHLKGRILPFLKDQQTQDLPEKLYLRRASGARKIANNAAVEKYLESKGYAVVELGKLTFLQQVSLFSKAKSVVGPSGAAFSNLIFAQHDTLIHILIGRYAETSYWYWQNLACSTGKHVVYSLGDLSSPRLNIHSDFEISLHSLNYDF